MKHEIKVYIIVFLIAILGASLGTIATSDIIGEYRNNVKEIRRESNLVLTDYTDIEPTDFTIAIDKTIDTVVEISCDVLSTFGTSTKKGSGVIISDDGYIVTNNHVVSGAETASVKLYDGSSYTAEIIGADQRSDIAVIKIDADKLKFSSFANSDEIELGQFVFAIGNPLGEGIAVSDGIISAKQKEIYIDSVLMNTLQTSAAINEGNSGGGLFDLNGNIVGIVNAKSSSNVLSSASVEGMGYAIPANTAVTIITDLIEYGYVKNRATLGITVSLSTNNSYFYQRVDGVMIQTVQEGMGAEKAGLKSGDIIIAVDDKDVLEYADLVKILNECQIGDIVTVTVFRDGKTHDYKVQLQEAIN